MKKLCRLMAVAACSAVFLLPMASADSIKVDYNHHTNFANYHTYTWGKVVVTDPLVSARIKRVVNADLQKEGWKEVPSGGQITIMAHDNVHNEQEEETFYSGMGGMGMGGMGMGWGGGWGWGGWGMGPGGGLGEEDTTMENIRVAHLVIDVFATQSKHLLWRGVSRGELSGKPADNRKHLFEDIDKMFRNFPPKQKH